MLTIRFATLLPGLYIGLELLGLLRSKIMSKQSSQICPRCRHESHAGDSFCGNCGLSLRESKDSHDTVSIRHRRIAPRTVFFLLLVGALILGILVGKEVLATPSNMGNTTPGGISTRPPTPTPVTKPYAPITLNANQDLPGLDTGIQLKSRDRLTIKASGLIELAPGRGICNNVPANPDGVSLVSGIPCQYTNPLGPYQSVYPSAPIGTLLASIGQVGTSSSTGWFVVGSSYSVTVWISGEFYLIRNDAHDGYYDNSGSYQVTITVVRG